MKVRTDFVSNSSSSSFVIFGNKVEVGSNSVVTIYGKTSVTQYVDYGFDASKFDELGPDEAYFIILRNCGSEGDYIFKLTPELLMDCDMHQIDMSKMFIVRGKFCMTEGGCLYPASIYGSMRNNYDYDEGDDDLNNMVARAGISVDGLKMFRFYKDYGNPTERTEIIQSLEREMKYT